jgi:hypothetical protein
MRGVAEGATASLVAAQWLGTRIPYKKLLFTSHDGLTTYDFSTDSVAYGDRILGIDHREEASETDTHTGGWSVITLNNPNNDIPDLRGYWVEIGHGLNTGTVVSPVYEYTLTPRQWVKKQSYIWYRGQYTVILELEDMWARFGEIPVHEPQVTRQHSPYFFSIRQGTTSILDLIKIFINNETAFDLTSHIDSSDISLEESDGIIDTTYPIFMVNEQDGEYETLLQVVTRLLEKTACYIVMRPTNTILIVYPGSSTTPDITYYRDTSPQYTGFIERTELVRPNTYYVFGGADDLGSYDEYGVWRPDWDWVDVIAQDRVIQGTYVNTTETTRYEEVVSLYTDPSIDSQGYADSLAEVMGSHRQSTDCAGRVTVRHDCRVELFDRIEVVN